MSRFVHSTTDDTKEIGSDEWWRGDNPHKVKFLPFDPIDASLICRFEDTIHADDEGKVMKRLVTNVPDPWNAPYRNFSWGYGGSGPHYLALCYCHALFPPGSDGYPAQSGRGGEPVSPTAWWLHWKLCEDVIARLPQDDPFTLPGMLLKAWCGARLASPEWQEVEARLDEQKRMAEEEGEEEADR